jgi:MFS family permease
MAELVPEPLRGVFWGMRGRNAGAVAIAASLIAAWLVDRDGHSASDPRTLGIRFGIGGLAGCIGIFFLAAIASPRRQHTREMPPSVASSIMTPVRDLNFRRFLVFSALWSLTSGFMAPFYTVYLLRSLSLSFFTVTLLVALTNILMAATQRHWGRLGDHFGTKPVLRIGVYLITLTPVLWLLSRPGRIWPIVVVEILSGIGWSAFHVSSSNLLLKLAPEQKRPSYLATFGAITGLAEGLAPLAGGIALSIVRPDNATPTVFVFRIMVSIQLLLFAIATALPGRIHEPGGTAVGHLIRVMGRVRSMDASRPAMLLYDVGYTHLARLADLIAREFPRDAEPI